MLGEGEIVLLVRGRKVNVVGRREIECYWEGGRLSVVGRGRKERE